MPAYIPLSIATFSIIGEKQARTLEPVLATPIRTVELLTGKAVAALVPGVLAGWVTYVAFVVLASFVYGPNLFGVVTDSSWLVGVFVLGPAVGLSSVVAGVIVSARVNDPRSGPADRRHHHRADHRGDLAPGDRHAPRGRGRVPPPGGDHHGGESAGAPGGRGAVRPGDDPDSVALDPGARPSSTTRNGLLVTGVLGNVDKLTILMLIFRACARTLLV